MNRKQRDRRRQLATAHKAQQKAKKAKVGMEEWTTADVLGKRGERVLAQMEELYRQVKDDEAYRDGTR